MHRDAYHPPGPRTSFYRTLLLRGKDASLVAGQLRPGARLHGLSADVHEWVDPGRWSGRAIFTNRRKPDSQQLLRGPGRHGRWTEARHKKMSQQLILSGKDADRRDGILARHEQFATDGHAGQKGIDHVEAG